MRAVSSNTVSCFEVTAFPFLFDPPVACPQRVACGEGDLWPLASDPSCAFRRRHVCPWAPFIASRFGSSFILRRLHRPFFLCPLWKTNHGFLKDQNLRNFWADLSSASPWRFCHSAYFIGWVLSPVVLGYCWAPDDRSEYGNYLLPPDVSLLLACWPSPKWGRIVSISHSWGRSLTLGLVARDSCFHRNHSPVSTGEPCRLLPIEFEFWTKGRRNFKILSCFLFTVGMDPSPEWRIF